MEWNGREKSGKGCMEGKEGEKREGVEGRGFFIGFGGWTPLSPNADNAYTKKNLYKTVQQQNLNLAENIACMSL